MRSFRDLKRNHHRQQPILVLGLIYYMEQQFKVLPGVNFMATRATLSRNFNERKYFARA